MESLSVYVVLTEGCGSQIASEILETLTELIKEEFGIDHTTIQVKHSSRREKEMQH